MTIDTDTLYKTLGIDVDKLGCIMANVEPLDIANSVEFSMLDDLYYGEGYQQGAVAEKTAHVTLLYGIVHANAGIDGAWSDSTVNREVIDLVLDGVELDTVRISHVGVFDVGDAWCVVGFVEKSGWLRDAHERLEMLPHITTHAEWIPHVTLAYVKKTADVVTWVNMLGDKFAGAELSVTGLNYGDDLP